jgi:peptide chain release factor 1
MKLKAHKEKVFSATKKDFRVDTFRGSGPGGQNRNRRDTAVRITHIETGLSAEAQDSRSQADNKKSAFHKLVKKLVALLKREVPKGTNTRVIRTYHEPRDTVYDYASGDKFSYKHTVGKRDMGPLIEARRRALSGRSNQEEEKA